MGQTQSSNSEEGRQWPPWHALDDDTQPKTRDMFGRVPGIDEEDEKKEKSGPTVHHQDLHEAPSCSPKEASGSEGMMVATGINKPNRRRPCPFSEENEENDYSQRDDEEEEVDLFGRERKGGRGAEGLVARKRARITAAQEMGMAWTEVDEGKEGVGKTHTPRMTDGKTKEEWTQYYDAETSGPSNAACGVESSPSSAHRSSPASSPNSSTAMVLSGDLAQAAYRCRHHPRKELDLFCKIHREVICPSCTCTRHLACQQRYLAQITNIEQGASQASSPFQGIEEAAHELRDHVLSEVIRVNENKDKELQLGATQVRECIEKNGHDLQELIARLEADRDCLMKAITRRHQENVEALRAAAEKKEKALQQQYKRLIAQVGQLKEGREKAQEVVQSLDVDEKPLELVQTCLQIMNQMNPVLEASTVTEPVERANLCVVLPSPDALLEAITSRGWAGSPEVDAAQCVLTGPSSVAYPIETTCTLTLKTRNEWGDMLSAPEGVVVVRASLVKGDDSEGRLVPFNMKDRGQGMYEIIVAITEELLDQELELHVAIGHQAVVGSPKRVLIVHNPLQSNILTGRQHRTALQALLSFVPGKTFHLLYRASQHGWSPSDFHKRCDLRGPTITLVKTSVNGSIFGGYTSESWESSLRHFKTDPRAFLFSLVNDEGLGPIKLPLIPGAETSAIYCGPKSGPTFGSGHDLYIGDQPHILPVCESDLGRAYMNPSRTTPHLLAGTQKFSLVEMEVYNVQ